MAASAVLKWKRWPMSTVAFCDHLVGLHQQGALARASSAASSAGPLAGGAAARRPRRQQPLVDGVGHLPPHPAQEAVHALDALVVPLGVALGRAHEEHVAAHRVGAVLAHHLVGAHHVALALGHLGALVVDHALGEQVLERLLETDQTQVVEHLGEEAGVHQVQDGVLHPADVLVHRQPVVDRVRSKATSVRHGDA